MNKNKIRKVVKGRLNTIAGEKNDRSFKISKKLLQLISRLNSQFSFGCTGVYAPLDDEPVWWQGHEDVIDFPIGLVHMHDEIKLSFYHVEVTDLVGNKYGLKLDTDSLQVVEPQLLIIPGVAFNRKCERLGRGKGYYDSYLKNFRGVVIGVFFSEQEIDDLPIEEHDMKLDYIVTDKEIIRG